MRPRQNDHISWQEMEAQRRRAKAKQEERRKNMTPAKLVRPDGVWCFVQAFSPYDAIVYAEQHGFPCPRGTGFLDGSFPTDPMKEKQLR